MRETLLSILVAAIAYLLGCFSTGLTVSGAKGVDIRNRGSKNTGASNVLRVMGLKSGLITFAGDFLKAALACWIGSLILPGTTFGIARYGMMLAGLFAIIGHNWPVFYGFKGGKGILCSGTLLLLLDWRIALVGWGAFVVLWLTTRYVSLGSVAAAVSLPFTTYFVFHNTACTVLGTCISLLVLWAHRSNIKRLLSGTESKFHFHVNAPKPGEDE